MVERHPLQKKPYSYQLAKEWYQDFALRIGLGASQTAVALDVLDYSPNPNIGTIAAAGIVYVASRYSQRDIEDSINHARYEANPRPVARDTISEQLQLLENPRLLAQISGGASTIAVTSIPETPSQAMLFGTIAIGAAFEGEERLVTIGRNIVKALKDTDGRPHPFLDQDR